MTDTKEVARKRKEETESDGTEAKVRKTGEQAPPSRYTQLPTQCGLMILEEMGVFFKNRVTDKWLCFEKQSLMKKHPDDSPDSIDEFLLSSLSENEKYNGMDLKQLISTLRDPTIIESTKLSSYISIGKVNTAEYIKKGGSYHCILCGEANLYKKFVCQESICNVPLFVIPGLTDVLFPFTELNGRYWGTIAFKKVKNNPFNEIVKLIADKIPNELSTSILHWKQSIVSVSTNSENEKEDVLSNVEKDNSKNEDLSETEVRVPDSSKTLTFTKRLPQIQIHHQQMIVQKIEAAFRDTNLPREWLLNKEKRLKAKFPDWSAEDMEKTLYKTLLFREEFAGEDILENILSISMKKLHSYFVTSTLKIQRRVKHGELFPFILYCSSATTFINGKTFQSMVSNIPLCSVEGLSTVLNKFFGCSQDKTIIGFKKAEGNPFLDLVKFIRDKIPDEFVSLMAVLEEGSDSVAKDICEEDDV